MTKLIRNTGPCFHLSLPRQRDVLSHTEFINVHILHALSLPDHPLRVTEKATHGKLVGPTLSTPRGDKYYKQNCPLCEVCPREHGKAVGTLQGEHIINPRKLFGKSTRRPTLIPKLIRLSISPHHRNDIWLWKLQMLIGQ